MKRYIVFGGDRYYPNGGWDDWRASFHTIDEARDYLLARQGWDWWHILDWQTQEIVERNGEVRQWGQR